MNAQEHAKEAEALLQSCKAQAYNATIPPSAHQAVAAMAQVNATLCLAQMVAEVATAIENHR